MSETQALMARSSVRSTLRGVVGHLRDFLLGAHGEIIVVTQGDAVALAEQIGDFLLHRRQRLGAGGLDGDAADGGGAKNPFHGAGIGHDHDIVLIRALRTERPLGINSPTTMKGTFLMRKTWPITVPSG